jgi:hypothetical protein
MTVLSLNRLEHGVLLADAAARVVFANRAAEAVSAAGGLRLRDRVAHTQAATDTTALHGMIDACGAPGIAEGGGYAVRHLHTSRCDRRACHIV